MPSKNGFQWMHWARTQHLLSSQKATLLVIASHCDSSGKTWLSYETLAEETSLHRATVIRSLRSLEVDGYLRRNGKHSGAHGHGHANVWELTGAIQPRLMALPPSQGATLGTAPPSHSATTHRRTGSKPPSLSAYSNNPRTNHRTGEQQQLLDNNALTGSFMGAVIDTWPMAGGTFYEGYIELEDEAGGEVALAAFREAQRAGQPRPSVKYLQAIIDRCQREGVMPGDKGKEIRDERSRLQAAGGRPRGRAQPAAARGADVEGWKRYAAGEG